MSLAISTIEPRRSSDRTLVWHLAVLAVGAAVPFAALATLLAVAYIRADMAEATAQVERMAQSTAQRAERMMVRDRARLAELSTRPGVTALDPARCDPILAELVKLHPERANAFTVDATGRRICSATYTLSAGIPAMDPRDFLDDVKAQKAFSISRPIRGLMTQKWIISEVQPILGGDGSVAGVVGISVDLLKLSSLVTQDPSAREPAALIMNSKGIVLAHHPDAAAWLGRDINGTGITRLALQGKAGSAREKGVTGVERLWSYAPVPGTDWVALSGIPTQMVMAPIYQSVRWVAALSGASIAFVIALCIVLARRISRPIAAIAAAARRISSHDSIERLLPSGPSETAALAEDLNRMLDRQMYADRELRARDNELSLMTDNYPGWVTHADRDMRFRYASAGYLAVMGRTSQEVLGTHVRDVVGDATFQRLGPVLAQALAGERQFFEDERTTPAGRKVSLFMTIVPNFVAGGEIDGVFVFATDITQLRQAETQLSGERSRLAGIVSSAMDAIITIDSAQRITLFNPAAEKMFGARAADMIDRDLQVLIPPSLRAAHSEHVRHFGMTGVTSRTVTNLRTIYAVRVGGEQFPIEASISQVEVGGEKFYTAILRDITERRKAEEDVRRLNADLERRVVERTAELEAANEELEAFDYSVAHDLRAPINRIAGFSAMLMDQYGDKLDQRGRGLLLRIGQAGRSMDELVGDLLSLSLTSRGELHSSDVDLGAIAKSIIANLRKAEPQREVRFEVSGALTVRADPGLVRVVLVNLLGNAWKFSGRRSDALVELGCLESLTGRTFFVRDNGDGFDSAKADKLFKPFQRLHSAKDFAGTGIGLATVQRIVRRHGGRIWAESTAGSGAIFFFTLSPPAGVSSSKAL